MNRSIHQIKQKSYKEKSITENKPTIGNSFADSIAKFVGSWRFIIIFLSILFLWAICNSVCLIFPVFDPYPFILMNLILSALAALQAPIIMMSQNSKDQRDRKRNELDYLINLKAESEVRNLRQNIDILLKVQMQLLTKVEVVLNNITPPISEYPVY